jgi:ABC-type antimicrobial peptide transport system permease subunit
VTIVGVVADVRQMGPDVPVKAEMYLPFEQTDFSPWFAPRDLAIRTSGDPMAVTSAVRRAIREVDANQPIANVRTMDEILGEQTAERRAGTTLLVAFAALALLLASIGVYGLLSYFVVQHTPEIGVRLALGAAPRDVLAMVLAKGMKLVLLGAAGGLIASLALARLISSLLFGVSPADPLTFACVAALLVAVALLACYIPARRAAALDPLTALRDE